MEDDKLYEEAGRAWRHYVAWREKIIAGYLTVVAALAVAFARSPGTSPRVGIAAAGVIVSLVFWILDFRNRAIVGACQDVAAALENERGVYWALDQRIRSQEKKEKTRSN